MAKSIVLLADGTGNSSAKLFKTNVWRLYQALDLSEPSDGETRQVAYYHDGVGTSLFRPLALLGGVFGVGLKRSVIDMYCFVCRNYEPGDQIYLFGFSRGAFTVRILASFLLNVGILRCATEEELGRYAPDAYRRYRRRFKLPFSLSESKADYRPTDPAKPGPNWRKTVGLVDRLRNARDGVMRVWRRWRGDKQFAHVARKSVRKIAFIGVWDTVAAYGLPFEELTRAIDDWIWPLSMPNHQLAAKVACARHALALDEERDSFQPLLWDEFWEAKLIDLGHVTRDRLKQVWFAGVHADVGGGYADDALSHVPLKWMMDEARGAKLRFKGPCHWGWTLTPDPFGHRHDSRGGVGAYYRPQSRRLVAKLDRPASVAEPIYPRADTLVLQDPRYTPPGQLTEVKVHESVIRRIKHGTDRYAPSILPPEFWVVDAKGTPTREMPSAFQNGREEWVFDDIWRRRITYFAVVVLSLILAAFPLLQFAFPPGACTGPQCILAAPIEWAGAILPAILGPWVRAFAAAPGSFAVMVALTAGLASLGATYRHRIDDGMRELWAESYGLPVGAGRPATKAGQNEGPPNGRVYRLRTRQGYQRGLQTLKWSWLPNMLGGLSLLLVALAGLLLAVWVVLRIGVAYEEAYGGDTAFVGARDRDRIATRSEPDVFETRWPTWPLGYDVRRGERYRMTLTVTRRWRDASIRASPLGNFEPDLPRLFPLAVPLRRTLSEGWYRPVLRIDPERGTSRLEPIVFDGPCRDDPARCGEAGQVFVAEFKADQSGRLSLFVNDALLSWSGITGWYYRNNEGAARVRLEILDGGVAYPAERRH